MIALMIRMYGPDLMQTINALESRLRKGFEYIYLFIFSVCICPRTQIPRKIVSMTAEHFQLGSVQSLKLKLGLNIADSDSMHFMRNLRRGTDEVSLA